MTMLADRWEPVVEGGIPMLKWVPPDSDDRWARLPPRARWRFAYQQARCGGWHDGLNPHMRPDCDRAVVALRSRETGS